MRKAAIIFHSVCGNTFLLAQKYQRTLECFGVSAALFRTQDPNYDCFAPLFSASKEFCEEIKQIPIIDDAKQLIEYDAIFMGSPTYFGNVSAAMKAFMDSFSPLWINAALQGKLFGSFACASTLQGGGDMCLNALNVFAQHMGMMILPVPANIKGSGQPAYGILHIAGPESTLRPNAEIFCAIEDYLSRAVNILCG